MAKHILLVTKESIAVRGLFSWKCSKWIWKEFEAGGRIWKQEPWTSFGMKVWAVPATFKSEGQDELRVNGVLDRGSFEGTVTWKRQRWLLTSNSMRVRLTDASVKVVAEVSRAWRDSDAEAGITHFLEAEDSLDPVLAAIIGGFAGGAIRCPD